MKYTFTIASLLICLSSFAQKMDTTFNQNGGIGSITYHKLFEDLKTDKIRSFEKEEGSFVDVFYNDNQKVDYKLEYKKNKAWNGQSKTLSEIVIYKNGVVLYSEERDSENQIKKKVFYREENQKFSGERFENNYGDRLSISSIENYLGNKKFTLYYENDNPFSGQGIEKDELITYKNGMKTGKYIRYNNSLKYSSDFESNTVIEKGNYIEGTKDGVISFFDENEKQIGSCEFKNGLPITGKVYNENTLSTYKDGVRNGLETFSEIEDEETLFYTQEYSNGILVGKCEGHYYKKYFHGKVVEFNFKGFYEKGEKFDGSFFDIKNEVLQHYIKGNKHGLFISKDDYFLNSRRYNNGVLVDVKKQLKKDKSIQYTCIFEGGEPFSGSMLTIFDEEIITDFSRGNRFFRERTYKNGEIVEKERWMMLKGKVLFPIATLNIEDEKYDGLALYNIDKTASNKIQFGEISGQYKAGKPLSGQFIEFIKPKKSKVYYQNSLDTRVNTYDKGKLISSKLYKPNKSKLMDLIIE